MSKIFFVPRPANYVEAQIYSDEGELLASHLMTTEGAEIRKHDMEAAISDARKSYNTHFHIYADGREFGICYSSDAADETVRDYRASFPTTRYAIRKVWRCPALSGIKRTTWEGAE